MHYAPEPLVPGALRPSKAATDATCAGWMALFASQERTLVVNESSSGPRRDGLHAHRAHGRRADHGILMAIAIPTFLSTQGSANDASAKSNATTPLPVRKRTSKTTRRSSTPVARPTDAATGLDPNLPWGANGAATGKAPSPALAGPPPPTSSLRRSAPPPRPTLARQHR